MLAYDRSTRADIACTSLTTDSDICCCGFRPVRVACSDPYKHLSVGEPCGVRTPENGRAHGAVARR